uniref:Crinkler effector protein N-terminal domain-containing protein n=1 Tax=Rhizophagus irregularis (strain DAOM 181602 / DAOM 197198 / MUCL 43194) TaxID=747089 RepID=U9UP52_RHIID
MPRRYQEEKAPEFDNFATDKLKLWKVDISFEENKKLELVNTKINANIKEDLGSEELSPLSKISKHFTFQPADISSYSVLLRRRKFTAPQRMVSRLRTCFTFPDGTEDEHIVINRECVIGKEIVCLVDDEDLASIIWTQGFKIDLPIVVDTSQQPFFVVDKSRRYSG